MLHARETTSGQQHYVIHGKTFKSALDEDGKLCPPAPTAIIHGWRCPVAKAVAVMEALHPNHPCYFQSRRSPPPPPDPRGSAVPPTWSTTASRNSSTGAMRQQSGWTAARHHPDRPRGNVTTSRFRRTLAWFIYRKPGGRIALGVQYGHLRGHTTDGYGSRSPPVCATCSPWKKRSPALTTSRTLHPYGRRRTSLRPSRRPLPRSPTAVWPGVPRPLHVRQASRRAAGQSPSADLRQLHPIRHLLLRPIKALCHPDRLGPLGNEETPDINHCQPNCGNIARTDRNIEQAADTIARHEAEIASPLTPEPLRARLAQRVAALQAIIATHNERTNDDRSN